MEFERHLEHLRLVAVDVDIDLRRRRGEGGEDALDARRLRWPFAMKSVATFSNSAGVRLARFCSRMEKPVWPPMPRTGGGMNTNVFDSSIVVHARADEIGDLVDRQPLREPLLGVVDDDEDGAGIGRVGERRPRPAGIGGGVGDAGNLQDHVVGAAHDVVGARERGAGRQLQRHDEEAAIHLGDEARGRVREQPAGARQAARRRARA